MAKEAAEGKDKKKAKRPQALKRDMQSKKKRLKNRSYKSVVRTAIRQLEESLPKGDTTATEQFLSEVYSLMDKGVKKGVLKKNQANRSKARLAAHVHGKKAAV